MAIRGFGAALAAGVCIVALAAPAEAQARSFDIPAGNLKAALDAYSRQAGKAIIYKADEVRSARTRGFRGSASPKMVLDKLLEESGFKAGSDNSGAVAVYRLGNVQGGVSPRGGADAHAYSSSTGDVEGDDYSREGTQDIVVTAQRRSERLVEVPLSITALTGNELARQGATQFRDYADTIPGLSYKTSGAGSTQIVLRGVTSGYDSSATVAVYVDDVPFGGSGPYSNSVGLAFDAGLFDLQRIEILRGPQGTLYGAGAVGGLLKYVSSRPSTTELEGQVQAGLASTRFGGLSSNLGGSINVPISEGKAGLRLSGYYNHDGGFIDNLALGKKDVNRADIYGGRIDFLLTPTDRFSLRLVAYAQNISRRGEGTADFTFAGLPSDGTLTTRRGATEPFNQKFRLISATLNYDIGAADITSISSYQKQKTYFAYDMTDFYQQFFPEFSAVGSFNNYNTSKLVQELRLTSKSKAKLEWVVGGFYTDEQVNFDFGNNSLGSNGQPSPTNPLSYEIPSKFQEYALFGTLTWHLTDEFDVSGGVRYSRNRQSYSQDSSGLFAPADQPLIRFSGNATTYLANARYRVTDRSILYLRYATGYRPGGANAFYTDFNTGETVAPAPYQSDYLHSYEAGFRHESFDRRFAVDLAAYYLDWKDTIILTFDSDTGGAFRANVAGTRVRGGELVMTARPIPSLSFVGTFTYTDAYVSSSNSNFGVKGERLPTVPRFTANLAADYTFRGVRWQPKLGATLRYTGDRRASFNSISGFPQYRLPDYTVVDLRAGLSLSDVDVHLYVRNLLDRRGQLSASTYYGHPRPAILQPRTIGVNLITRF